MNVLQALKDPNLFRPFLGADLRTWRQWVAALQVVYGLPVHSRRRHLVGQCTGRNWKSLRKGGFSTSLFIVGRRSGKSRIAAVIGAYEAVLAGHEKKLAKGERGIVAICAPTLKQGRIVKDYLRAIFEAPVLADQVVGETREGFELISGTRIEILAGDFRTVRGYTLLAAIVDELSFFGLDAEARVKSDTELVRAIKPSLATVGGKLIAITSPYAKKGYCYEQWRKNFRNDAAKVLVWNCPSRTMNPTLPQSVVDEAMAEDLQAARSEYGGEFRDDIEAYLPRQVIEALVVHGRKALLPRTETRYVAFADLSGGRADDASLAVAHREAHKVVVDFTKRYRPPCNPHEVVKDMAEELKRYQVRKVTGDNYAAEFVARAFEGQGVQYQKSPKPKSALYLELLPRLCSKEIELLDDEVLVEQLSSLERRTRSGGKDIIDHPPGGHDDLANVIAGVAEVATAKFFRVGGLCGSIRRSSNV